jgi:outer membrane lipoprotein SlyB
MGQLLLADTTGPPGIGIGEDTRASISIGAAHCYSVPGGIRTATILIAPGELSRHRRLLYLRSRRRNLRTTGTIARIRKDITPMFKTAPVDGSKWCRKHPSNRGEMGHMNTKGMILTAIIVVVTLSGCATVPAGPSVMVLPAPGKPFEVFQADEAVCRQWATQQSGAQPSEIVNQNIANSAAVGALAGAAIGAVIGSTSGHAGSGAAIGAGTGLVGGAAAGSGPAYASGWQVQRRYDIAYQQCMYAKGNQIPGSQRPTVQPRRIPPPPPTYRPGSVPPPPPPHQGW